MKLTLFECVGEVRGHDTATIVLLITVQGDQKWLKTLLIAVQGGHLQGDRYRCERADNGMQGSFVGDNF